MKNYILGSGLISFIAKELFPSYEIIPVGKSRYFRYEVATCDDYIICNDKIDDFMKDMSIKSQVQFIPMFFKRALSVEGQLIFNKHPAFFKNWEYKLYNDNGNELCERLTKMEFFTYNLSSTQLFGYLENKHKQSFKEFVVKNDRLLNIYTENKRIITKNQILEYDNIISTIPLNILCKYCSMDVDLESIDLHTFVLETDAIDFEGASELLVVDQGIEFYKCTKIGKRAYQFFSNHEISNLGQYMSLVLKNFNLLSGTVVKFAIPLGDPNYYKIFNNYGIHCVGSNAQWDDMMDVASCIIRLQNLI